jgi:hypothetical protein
MDYSKIIRAEDIAKLEANWTEQLPRKGRNEIDYEPVVLLRIKFTTIAWLLTEKEPGGSMCFGLCDMGQGYPEIGYLDLEDLASTPLPPGHQLQQETDFIADKPLSKYASAARSHGAINA